MARLRPERSACCHPYLRNWHALDPLPGTSPGATQTPRDRHRRGAGCTATPYHPWCKRFRTNILVTCIRYLFAAATTAPAEADAPVLLFRFSRSQHPSVQSSESSRHRKQSADGRHTLPPSLHFRARARVGQRGIRCLGQGGVHEAVLERRQLEASQQPLRHVLSKSPRFRGRILEALPAWTKGISLCH